MKPFIRRELARQAPIALASLLLGLVVLAGVLVLGSTALVDMEHGARSASLSGLAIVMIAAPLLLGVATVAPDSESGAVAFLVHFPHSRAAELAIRWSVAAGLSAAAIGLDALATWLLAGPVHLPSLATIRGTEIGLGLVAVGAFVAGTAASIAFRRTLNALVAAPFLLALPALALSQLEDVFTFPRGGIVLAGVPAIALVLVLAAIVAFFRGDLHRRGLRPTFIVLGVLAASTLVVSGAVSARELHLSKPLDTLYPWFRSNSRFVVKRTWQGPHGETLGERYLLVARDRSSATALDIKGEPIELSPDGSRILAHGEDGMHLCLVAVGTGEVDRHVLGAAPEEGSRLVLAGIAPTGWADSFAWCGNRPVFVKDGALVEAFGVLAKRPSGRIVAQGGARLVVSDGSRHYVWDLNAGQEIPSSLDDLPGDRKVVATLLSRDGTRLFALCASPVGEEELCFMPVAAGRIDRYVLPSLEGAPRAMGLRHSFWAMPGGAVFRQFLSDDRALLVRLDYASGTFHEIPNLSNVNDVAPDARTFLQGWTNVVDLATGKVVLERPNLGAFLDSEHLFGFDSNGPSPLREIVDVRTKTVTPYR